MKKTIIIYGKTEFLTCILGSLVGLFLYFGTTNVFMYNVFFVGLRFFVGTFFCVTLFCSVFFLKTVVLKNEYLFFGTYFKTRRKLSCKNIKQIQLSYYKISFKGGWSSNKLLIEVINDKNEIFTIPYSKNNLRKLNCFCKTAIADITIPEKDKVKYDNYKKAFLLHNKKSIIFIICFLFFLCVIFIIIHIVVSLPLPLNYIYDAFFVILTTCFIALTGKFYWKIYFYEDYFKLETLIDKEIFYLSEIRDVKIKTVKFNPFVKNKVYLFLDESTICFFVSNETKKVFLNFLEKNFIVNHTCKEERN